MKRKILILNGSSSEIPLIKAAKRLGYYVITTGNDPLLVGHKYSDEYISADYSNADEIEQIIKKNDIYAIVSNSNDWGMITATYLANKLHLPGLWDSMENCLLLHEKDKFKEYLQNHNYKTAKSKTFYNQQDAIDYLGYIDYPIMIKSVDNSGGRGVKRVNSKEDGTSAIKEAFLNSKSKIILVEEYIPGRQYDYHTIIMNGKIIWESPNNEYSFINEYQVNCLTIPADHSDNVTKILHNQVERLARELHLVDGLLWLQYRIKNDEPVIIESSRRCGGNNMIELVSNAYEEDFGELLVRMQTGMDYSQFNKKYSLKKMVGYQTFMAERNGILDKIVYSDDIKQKVISEYFWYKNNEIVDNYLYQKFGIIIFECKNIEELKRTANTINTKAFAKVK